MTETRQYVCNNPEHRACTGCDIIRGSDTPHEPDCDVAEWLAGAEMDGLDPALYTEPRCTCRTARAAFARGEAAGRESQREDDTLAVAACRYLDTPKTDVDKGYDLGMQAALAALAALGDGPLVADRPAVDKPRLRERLTAPDPFGEA